MSRENDLLLGRNIAKSRQLLQQVIDLPQDLNELHFLILKLQEELITTSVAKERLEEVSRRDKRSLEGESLIFLMS